MIISEISENMAQEAKKSLSILFNLDEKKPCEATQANSNNETHHKDKNAGSRYLLLTASIPGTNAEQVSG